MSAKNYKNPKDFEIPENYHPIAPGALYQAAQSPELRPLIRYFAKQADDVMSGYLKDVKEADEEREFLKQCRKDSKAFRRALEKRIRAAEEALKGDKSMAGFIFEQLHCSNKADEGYLFSVELRPLLFTSLLTDEEKEGHRYPPRDHAYTVFLHFDKNHKFQMTRFSEPGITSPYYQHLMVGLLSVFSRDEIQRLLEQHYGDWEMLSEKIVGAMLESFGRD